MRRRWFAVVECVAVAGMLGGCLFAYDAAPSEVSHETRLDVDVTIQIDGANSRFERSVASRGFSGLTMDECRGTTIVVQTEDGDLVGRVDEPACPGGV